MNILVVDDEKLALQSIVSSILKYNCEYAVHAFSSPMKALSFARDTVCDVAFLDINMFGMDGVQLAKQLQEINGNINIIFTTGYSEYMKEAFAIHASGYITKPVTLEKIKYELENLRNAPQALQNKLFFRCFGSFEVFIGDRVMNFKYNKTKELLAYLIDRKGASCSNPEIMGILWGDEVHDSYLRNIRKDLIDTFACEGLDDCIQSTKGKINICGDKFNCDYYDWLNDHSSVKYQGEYMSQYSWAEDTNAWISYEA